uniref:Uncharacterized protein n=1 Tax=Romanomermis culicivorax TaxID=13658 RepID=A0A915JHQ4_ROMCU
MLRKMGRARCVQYGSYLRLVKVTKREEFYLSG